MIEKNKRKTRAKGIEMIRIELQKQIERKAFVLMYVCVCVRDGVCIKISKMSQ